MLILLIIVKEAHLLYNRGPKKSQDTATSNVHNGGNPTAAISADGRRRHFPAAAVAAGVARFAPHVTCLLASIRAIQ